MNVSRKKNEFFYIEKAIQMIDSVIDWLKLDDNSIIQTSKKESNTKNKKYLWTGDIIDFVEIIYALVETGVINNGEVEIKAVIEYLGSIFGISVNRCYDFYYKMRTRSGSRTAFLDKIKRLLEAKMDKDEEKNDKKRR
jgi:hypothetical protein